MGLLTTYNDNNMIVRQGKTQRITCGAPTDPTISIKAKIGDSSQLSVSLSSWYEMICHSTANFSYVGMDYSTASSCRDAMIGKFTRQKKIWEFKESYNAQTSVYTLGWQEKGTGTVQEAEVNLTPTGGHMYQVDVNVDCEDITYTTTPGSVTFSYPTCMDGLK